MRSTNAREWLGKVKGVGCVLCIHLGVPQVGPTFAHHPRDGVGAAQRGGDFTTIALCYEHHQGASGIHGLGTKGFYNRYKINEWELADMTIEAVYRAMRRSSAGLI